MSVNWTVKFKKMVKYNANGLLVKSNVKWLEKNDAKQSSYEIKVY